MSARRRLTVLAAAAFVAVSVAIPGIAVASTASAGGALDVQIWPQDGQNVVITSVQLPESAKLPAIVRIPIVPGATVQWAGEIIGADVSGDISRDYKLVDGVGGKYAEFFLTKSHRGQIDSVASSLTVTGTTISTTVNWVQSVSASETLFSVRLPSTVSQVSITPAPDGKPAENGSGETLYLLPSKLMKPGEATAVSLSYNTVPAPVADPATSEANTITWVLGVVLALAVVALVVVIRRRAS